MTNESGSAAPPRADNPSPNASALVSSAGTPPIVGAAAGWLAVPALGWLAVMLWSAHVGLRARGDDALGITEAAIGLPAVISAALVAGAAAGVAVLRLGGGRLHDRPTGRLAATLAAGLLTGIASAGSIVLTHASGGTAIMVLAGTIAAGATLGGALAGAGGGALVGAGVAASLGVFLLTFVRELFNSELLRLFGAADSPVSQLTAQQRLAWAASLVGGLAAGLIAFYLLRRFTRRSAQPPRGPAYLLAGGSAGLMLLLTEAVARVGGARVLSLARSVSDGDEVFQDMAASSRINSALVVFFVGAVTAMIAFGRTLHPVEEELATSPEQRPATPPREQPAAPPEESPAPPAEEQPATPPEQRPATPPREKPATPPRETPAPPAGERTAASSVEEHPAAPSVEAPTGGR